MNEAAINRFPRFLSENKWLAAILALAAALRVAGFAAGLPAIVHADEPHFVNTAVYFGSGTLNPPQFKYPTLWLYTLFAEYGGIFALWSGFGLLRSANGFARLFVSDPTLFYASGRLLASLFSCLAIIPVYRAALLITGRRTALLSALALAVSPHLIYAAHYAKWESLMLFLSALAWYFALKIYLEGRLRDYLFCGACLGLCASTHYMGGFFSVLLPAAHLTRCLGVEKRGLGAAALDRRFWLGALLIPTAFLAGTPYAALDFPKFKAGITDIFNYSRMRKLTFTFHDRLDMSRFVIKNIASFCGASPALLFSCAALFLLAVGGRIWLAALLIAPLAAYFILLSGQPDGGFMRYLFNSFPPLAITAAYGVSALADRLKHKAAFPVLAAFLILPGFWQSADMDRRYLLPDTRLLSAEWIINNIPPESRLLMDQPHSEPLLPISRNQLETLYARTAEDGHPRAKYFKLMLEAQTGPGYRIYRMRRAPEDLAVLPEQLKWTQKGYDLLDIDAGIAPVKQAGTQYVITSDLGIEPERVPQARQFFSELQTQARLLKTFAPSDGEIEGPVIKIYSLQ